MRYALAVLIAVATLACDDESASVSGPEPVAPEPTSTQVDEYTDITTTSSRVADAQAARDRDFTALALPLVNAERLETGEKQAVECTIIATFRGKSLYKAEDNSLGLLTKKATGSVAKEDKKKPDDLVFVWVPVFLDETRLRTATIAAGLCR